MQCPIPVYGREIMITIWIQVVCGVSIQINQSNQFYVQSLWTLTHFSFSPNIWDISPDIGENILMDLVFASSCVVFMVVLWR